MFEWEFNRDVTNRIKKILDKYSKIKVILTSPNDTDTSLAERVRIAKDNHVDIFVSIHANAYGITWNTACGWEIYVYEKYGKPLLLAEDIEKNSIPYLGLKDRGIKIGSSLYVINQTHKYGIPSVLVEHGFYTNKSELELLKSDDFREKCAIADAKGILQYLGIKWGEEELAVTTTEVLIDGKIYNVNRILYNDKNYIELRSLEQAGFKIDYKEGIPTIDLPKE